MFEAFSSYLQRALSWGGAFALRWYWAEARLAARVRTSVAADRQGVRVNGGELPEVTIWLEVQNLTPFPIEVDRLFGEIFCGGRITSFVYLERRRIKHLESQVLHIHADMTEGQARYLANTQQGNRIRIVLNGFVHCRVRDFKLTGRSIESGNVELINVRPTGRPSA